MRFIDRIGRRILDRLGGPAHVRIVLLLAVVLSLDSADAGAIGGMATPLQRSLGIGTAELGLLFTVESAVAAVGTAVFGWLVDRTRRTRLLAIVIVLWGAVTILCGAAGSYRTLLVMQLLLGAVIGAATPAVASLVGDFFRPEARARAYGAILSGEMLGTAIGLVVAGLLSGISWRLGFWVLALPVPFVAWAMYRLPEPERGGGSWIGPADERGPAVAQSIGRRARDAGFAPRARLVRDVDPSEKSFLWALRYVLHIPTNVVLIVCSALGYYFFGGLRIFALQLLRGRYHLSHEAAIAAAAVAGSGAVIGVYAGGRIADRLLARGHLRARIGVVTSAYLASSALFFCGLLASDLVPAVLLYFLAASALGAVNPPLDAARLDIMHPRLWGRAEGIRMTMRKVAEAGAPVVFGYAAESIFGGGPSGLYATFLVMLIPLGVSGLVGVAALRTYLRDAASADAFAERTRGRHA